MNFFGHAAVASWFTSEPAVVLGAMLPDFLSMLRIKAPPQRQPDLAAGIELHHRTDSSFHENGYFVSLNRVARAALDELGFGRGPARAVAHVGVELLLDEWLQASSDYRAAYRGALDQRLWQQVALPSEAEPRFEALGRALASRAEAGPVASDVEVATRIERALARRPLLALAPDGAARLLPFIADFRQRVGDAAPSLLRDLRGELVHAGGDRVRAPGARAT